MSCDHKGQKAAKLTVNCIEDVGRFSADVEIRCAKCGIPFRFIGLPVGCDINSPTVSADATQAMLPCHPKGEIVPDLDDNSPSGFKVVTELGDTVLRMVAIMQQIVARNGTTLPQIGEIDRLLKQLGYGNRR